MKNLTENLMYRSFVSNKRKIITGLLLVWGLQSPVNAQLLNGLDHRVKAKVKTRVDNHVDQAIDKGLDQAETALKEDSKSKQPVENTQASQPAEQEKVAAKEQEKPRGLVVSASKYDFIPGEKILYMEDFSSGAIGEMPVDWNASGNGQVVSLEGHAGKWLRMFPGNKYLSGMEKDPGENYTVEFDVLVDGVPPSGTRYLPEMTIGLLASAGKPKGDNVFLGPHMNPDNVTEIYFKPNVDQASIIMLESRIVHGQKTFSSERSEVADYGKTIGKIAHYAIQVQKQRFRFWIDGVKIFDVPRAVTLLPALDQLFFRIKDYWVYNESNYGMYVSNIKVAGGLPDMRHKLVDEGKFSTTGILFDVNSDKVQPQSYGTIQAISQILKDNAGMRIRIIGHTDSDGEPAANLLLSHKRAAAVQSILEKEFGHSSARIETDGKGEAEPVTAGSEKDAKALSRRGECGKL